MPAEVLQRLSPRLELVPLVVEKVLHQPGEPIEYVYFPGGGFVSELTVLESGDMVEIATIGREGMVGIFASDDGHRAPSLSMVQAAADVAYRLPAARFREEMDRRGALRQLMTRYMHACRADHAVDGVQRHAHG